MPSFVLSEGAELLGGVAHQQVLRLRALGVGLPEVGRILAEQVDEVDALRGHHRRLLADRERLDALAGTVSRTIGELEQSRKDGNPMTINRPETESPAGLTADLAQPVEVQ